MLLEHQILLAGGALYILAAVTAVAAQLRGRGQNAALALLVLALLVHGVAILLRWDRLDHGPYLNMFGALSGNVWTLHASLLLGTLLLKRLRPLLATGLPLLQVMTVWLLTIEPVDSVFPPTFDTFWLAVHIWLGKFFMGLMLIAVAAGVVVVIRRLRRPEAFAALPNSGVLDELSFRLVLLAFVFDSLMLVAGAIWAQQAWGAYWTWDPVETWSFVTWLAVGIYLHLRVIERPPPEWSAALIFIGFALGFVTYFGVPFVSSAPHQGMV